MMSLLFHEPEVWLPRWRDCQNVVHPCLLVQKLPHEQSF